MLSVTETIAKLRQHGFPSIFEEIQNKSVQPTVLKIFHSPSVFYHVADKGLGNAAQSWIPLWERSGPTLYAYDVGGQRFIRHDYSSGDCEEIARGYQQFITYVLLHLAEIGVEDELDQIAISFQYKYLPFLKQKFYGEVDEELDFESFCNKLIREVDSLEST